MQMLYLQPISMCKTKQISHKTKSLPDVINVTFLDPHLFLSQTCYI